MSVTEPRSAAVFADSRQRRLLLLFAGAPRSLAETAATSGEDLKRLHHLATRLCRLGLLRVVGERRRAGRPIKLYLAAAPAFFVPEEASAMPFAARLARELRGALARDRLRSGARGMLFTLDAAGQPVARTIGDDETAIGSGEMWRVLRLSAAEAASLAGELRDVLLRYEGRASPGGMPHLVHAAVARRQPADAP